MESKTTDISLDNNNNIFENHHSTVGTHYIK